MVPLEPRAVQLGPGSTAVVELSLETRGLRIELVDGAGRPLPDSYLTLTQEHPGGHASEQAMTDELGGLRLPSFPLGSLRLEMRRQVLEPAQLRLVSGPSPQRVRVVARPVPKAGPRDR